MSEPAFHFGADTDVGRQREHNEDTFICSPDLGIFAVIDGVGGEAAGETAAKKAQEILLKRLQRRTAPPGQRIREAITLANNAIFEQARKDPRLRGMACVLTVVVLEDGNLVVGHVGDTRLYRLRRGGIEQVTRDHSPVGQMEADGRISEWQAMEHPQRSEIYRDVGSELLEPESPDFVDLHELPLRSDEALLLCSDGLSDLVSREEVRHLVERYGRQPQEAVRRLIEAANRAGGKDNVTAVLLTGAEYMREGAPAPSGRVRSNPVPPAAEGPGPAPAQAPASGAGRAAKRGPIRRLKGFFAALVGRRARRAAGAVLVLVLLGWLLLWAARHDLFSRVPFWGGAESPAVLRVGGEGATHQSIGEALAAARPGQEILVAPGVYDEQIELRSGVAVSSTEPAGAVLRPTREGSELVPAVVVAEGVWDAKLAGFRIDGGDGGSFVVGVRLTDSSVEVENVEVTGAREVGIEVSGDDGSRISYSRVADNGRAGMRLRGPVRTKLRHNRVVNNGAGGATGGVGIDLDEGANPVLDHNLFAGNGQAAIRGLPEGREQWVRETNSFADPADVISTVPPVAGDVDEVVATEEEAAPGEGDGEEEPAEPEVQAGEGG